MSYNIENNTMIKKKGNGANENTNEDTPKFPCEGL